MEFAICSFSFHRTYAANGWDARKFIDDCAEMGIRQLDPWNAHLCPIETPETALHAGKNPNKSGYLQPASMDFYDELLCLAAEKGCHYGLIAIDGAHIYEPDESARNANRERAFAWLDVASRLDAKSVRIDAGGRESWTDEQFDIIVDGYNEIIAYAANLYLDVLVENHWGPTTEPDQMNRLLDAVPRLGLLFDTNNWKPELREEAWDKCAHRAKATHVKTFSFDDSGAETSGQGMERAIRKLVETGYAGTWGVESMPEDGDEYAGAKKTIQFIASTVAG